MYKMKGLLSLCNVKVLKKLSLFISKLQNVLQLYSEAVLF